MSSKPNIDDNVEDISPRIIGRYNFIGVQTLIQKEVGRFLNVYMQTIIAPVVTLLMFFVVFSLSFSHHLDDANSQAGMIFLAPGLLMMTMAQNAFANPSSSLIIAKVQGNIVDVLMPPLSATEILIGMMFGSILRCLIIGALGFLVINLIVPLSIYHWGLVIAFGLLGNVMLASLGMIAGLWAEKFDHMATITNFIITPLTFLSGTFYSLSALPEAWQFVAHLNPFFYMIDGFRAGFISTSETNHSVGLIFLTIVNMILILGAWFLLKTGYKTKY
jgi:ABC-2 type transport system permease protein